DLSLLAALVIVRFPPSATTAKCDSDKVRFLPMGVGCFRREAVIAASAGFEPERSFAELSRTAILLKERHSNWLTS
ncbi:MAG: hypothetical protein ACLPIC_18165, partial [Rhodoblastus sp.]|uniref:hypothetical protein n=1 Tax=Rhodoblastus sp. TaxID=1962975 RepID=UPI003F9BF0A7